MASSLQNKQTTAFQTIAYQGVIPPPDMMERFKKLEPGLPERIVRMAERSLDMAEKELDIANREIDVASKELDIQAQDMSRKQHEAETMRMAIEKGSRYDFRAQIIILAMVVFVLGAAVLLGVLGLSSIAYLVVAGGFATIITAAIKGVSKQRQ